jgi:signal-transduction protein with cAMP-binding, CBS, and nucleotidyltransferase domain
LFSGDEYIENLTDLVDPFVPAASATTKVWETAIKMNRLRRPCAVVFNKDPSGDLGLYVTARRVARELFELSEEGLVVVERGRISWILDRNVIEISDKIRNIPISSKLYEVVNGIYSDECLSLTDDSGNPVGCITEDSLIRVLVRTIPSELRAGDVASSPIETIDLEAPLLEAIGVMVQRGFRRLVVSDKGIVIGVVVMLDIISKVSEAHIKGNPDEVLIGKSISGIGYEEPLFVPEDTSLVSLAKKLLNTRSKCVLVGSPESPAGIITEKDIIRVIMDSLKDQ